MNVRKPIALQRLGERSVQRAGRHGRDEEGAAQLERANPASDGAEREERRGATNSMAA